MTITNSEQNSRINQDDQERARLVTKTIRAASAYLDELDNRLPATDYTPKPLLPLPTQGAGAKATLGSPPAQIDVFQERRLLYIDFNIVGIERQRYHWSISGQATR